MLILGLQVIEQSMFLVAECDVNTEISIFRQGEQANLLLVSSQPTAVNPLFSL